jgi:hypothetical protein
VYARHGFGPSPPTRSTSRGHAVTVDSGWREVADTALAFVKRFA